MNSPTASIDQVQQAEVLERFGCLMRALHRARGARPSPWAECPLTLQQLRALSLLGAGGPGLMSRELAARLGVSPPAVTALVERLVEQGFVERREEPHDRRVTRLVASDAGVALLGRMSAGQADLLQDILAHLTPAQRATVGEAFTLLIAGAERVLAEDTRAASLAALPSL